MSWDPYIDRLLEGNPPVGIGAAICGLDGSVWASKNMNITLDEVKPLASCERSSLMACGPKISGTKCRVLRDNLDDEVLRCMDLKTASDADGNTYNVCVGKTAKTIIILRGTKEANGGQLAKKVCEIGDHLRSAGF